MRIRSTVGIGHWGDPCHVPSLVRRREDWDRMGNVQSLWAQLTPTWNRGLLMLPPHPTLSCGDGDAKARSARCCPPTTWVPGWLQSIITAETTARSEKTFFFIMLVSYLREREKVLDFLLTGSTNFRFGFVLKGVDLYHILGFDIC